MVNRYCIVTFLLFGWFGWFPLTAQSDALQDSILSLIDEIEDPRERFDAIIENAFYYDFAPFLMPSLSQARALSEETGDESMILESLVAIGQSYNFRSKYDSSHVFFDEGLAKPYINDHIGFKVELLEGKAVAFSRQENIQEAINYFSRSIEIIENPISRKSYIDTEGEEDLLKMSSIIYNNVANLYKRIEQYDPAVSNYDKAIKIMLDLDAIRYAATVINNKAGALEQQGDLETALEEYKRAKELKIEYDATPRSIALSDLSIGTCLGALGRHPEALETINAAIEVFEEINYTKGITYGYAERGIIYNRIGLSDQAIQDCNKSREILEQDGIVDYSNQVYDCLYRSYKNNGLYKQALLNLEKLNTIQDSVLNAKNFRKIGQLESQLEFEKKQALSTMRL
ncbi:MAG: tetratricopeptide repeat protein, partial [Bacteroidota bacterium]